MRVYAVVTSWGYDGGDSIEGIYGTGAGAFEALRDLAQERHWEVREGLHSRSITAEGNGLGYGIRIVKWTVA